MKLTPEKFAEIYTNEEFRNQVATAHGCYTSYPNSQFKHFETCSYPTRYIVTQEQIDEAQKEQKRAVKKAIANLGNKLVFVGMGVTYEPTEISDIGNHRIRTNILAPSGKKFFVEFGHYADFSKTHCDHSIDLGERERKNDGFGGNNYGQLERKELPPFTKANILSIVNRTFDCKFTEMVVDNYTLSTDDYKSVSPR